MRGDAEAFNNCLALARRLASPAPYGLAALRLGYPRLRSAHFAPRWTRRFPRPPTPLSLQAAREEGRGDPKRLKSDGRKPKWGSFKENYALLKKLSEM